MTEVAPTSDKPLFTAVEVEQFEADDVVAGSAIGKMLSILFLYTVLAMLFVGWWTWDASRTRAATEHEQTQQPEEHAGH